MSEPKLKCHCGKLALCKVNDKGFCGDHREQAVAAMKRLADGTKLGSKPADDRGAFYDRRRQA